MFSIKNMAAGQEQYYIELAREDYYTQGGEKPGVWHGAGAKHLGLEGRVDPNHLRHVLAGRGPDGEQLVQIQANREHRPAWDGTFSADKTVSVLWAISDETVRKSIESAHYRAVCSGLDYLQANALICRRGSGGKVHEHAKMIAALYEHGTSRNQDPQLHTHVLIANVAVRSDGTTGTIESRYLYEHQKAAGAVYRAKLASILSEELGLRITPYGEFFRIEGIPAELVERCSSRRKEILEALKQKGIEYSPAAAEIAALDTRAVKGHVARAKLFEHWRKIGQEYGFGPREAAALLHQGPKVEPTEGAEAKAPQAVAPQPANGQQEAVKAAVDAKIVVAAAEALGEKCGIFREQDLVQAAAVAAQHRAIAPERVLTRIAEEEQPGGELVIVEMDHREIWLATKASRELTDKLEAAAERLMRNDRHQLREVDIERCLKNHHPLSLEQRELLSKIASGKGAFHCIDGLAGSGKSDLLGVMAEAYRNSWFHVIGCAPTAAGARELQASTGIESRTIASLLWQSDPSLGRVLKHEARQVVRAVKGKRTYSMPGNPLSSSTVLVVDHASIASAGDLNRLLQKAASAGAKVILTGDSRSMEAISQPGAFQHLLEKFGGVKLKDIHRQDEPWARDAITQAARGDVGGALTQFALAGRAHVCPSTRDAMRELVTWWGERKTENPANSLIVAQSQKAVSELNALAQAARYERGELGKVMKQRLKGTWVYNGDRVMFTRGSKPKGYATGDMGTVEAIGLDTLTIRLDRTKTFLGFKHHVRVKAARSEYKHLQLGYAVTAYKAQSMAADRVFALTELVSLDHASSDEARTVYVQLSRAKEETQVFLTTWDDCQLLGDMAESARQTERIKQHDVNARARWRQLTPPPPPPPPPQQGHQLR